MTAESGVEGSPTAASGPGRSRPASEALARPGAAALAGLVAAGVAIAAGELVAALVPGAPSLIIAIGALVIDLQPPGAKDFVVSLFGSNDKLALNVLVVVVALPIAAIAGIVARRQFAIGAGIFVAFGAVALVAASASR